MSSMMSLIQFTWGRKRRRAIGELEWMRAALTLDPLLNEVKTAQQQLGDQL